MGDRPGPSVQCRRPARRRRSAGSGRPDGLGHTGRRDGHRLRWRSVDRAGQRDDRTGARHLPVERRKLPLRIDDRRRCQPARPIECLDERSSFLGRRSVRGCQPFAQPASGGSFVWWGCAGIRAHRNHAAGIDGARRHGSGSAPGHRRVVCCPAVVRGGLCCRGASRAGGNRRGDGSRDGSGQYGRPVLGDRLRCGGTVVRSHRYRRLGSGYHVPDQHG